MPAWPHTVLWSRTPSNAVVAKSAEVLSHCKVKAPSVVAMER